MDHPLQGFDKKGFTATLLKWFKDHKRRLPWRESPTPYHVWVSEIMLQQTQVKTVIPYYLSFIERFPTIYDLAMADETEVLKAWEGLGYYSRARNLHQSAKIIMAQFGGIFPSQYEDILQLKGIGTYTAGAILSMAFGKKYPAVDGNIMRVMSRVLYMTDDIALSKTKRKFEQLMNEIVPDEDPGAFNQSLMDLGAMVCTPKSIKCEQCPVRAYCRGFQLNHQHELPVKSKRSKPQTVSLITLIVQDDQGRFLLMRRPSEGLLGGLWELIQFEAMDIEEVKGQPLFISFEDWTIERDLGEAIHHFSHRVWMMHVYWVRARLVQVPEEMAWYTREELSTVPISTAHKKLLEGFVSSQRK